MATQTFDRRPILGINFGNSYASIAIIDKEGHADCIANEDGERQIACALAYNGEEVYIGNQAKPQLVKNSKNTIVGFRNLLGKEFGESKQDAAGVSAPVVDLNGSIGYTVDVLVPPPKTKSNAASARSTPAPTRPSSPPAPVPSSKSLTVSEVSTILLSTLKKSAEDFLGKTIEGAVIGVPSYWDSKQKEALSAAATDAGLEVLQLANEEALAVLGAEDSLVLNADQSELEPPKSDRRTLVLDLGSSSLTLSLVSVTDNSLVHSIASSYITAPEVQLGGDAIDSALVTHFFKEFTKKTKIPTPTSLPAKSNEDKRAEAKMRLAVEHTKRTIQASAGAASCSVESLKDGMDFSGTINRLRFDLLLSALYGRIISQITALLSKADLPKQAIDEVLLVGGSAGLSGLVEQLELFFGENSKVAIRSELDSSQLIAKGAALQAKLLIGASTSDEKTHKALTSSAASAVSVTSKPIGLYFPGAKTEHDGLQVVVVAAETPLPTRRTVLLPLAPSTKSTAFEVCEGEATIVELPLPPKSARPADDDEDDDEDEEPEKILVVKKSTVLTGLKLDFKGKPAYLEVSIDVDSDGSKIGVRARGSSGEEESGEWTSS